MKNLATNRGVFIYIVFTALTLGIYPLYYIHRVSVELNETCDADHKKTAGLLAYILLTILTFGIYAIVWQCLAVDRMAKYCERYGLKPRLTVVCYLLWNLFGSMLFGLGPVIAMYKSLHMHNDINYDHNMLMIELEKSIKR